MRRPRCRSGAVGFLLVREIRARPGRVRWTGAVERNTMIKEGSEVKLHYTLTVEDEVIDSSRQRGEPISYVHGQGQIVPGLEEQLEGMAAGDTKKADVPPEKGYGPRRPDAMQTVPKGSFQDPSGLKQGDVVSGQAQGQPFQATVAEVGEEEITLDLNHPLAGKTLHFDVEILEVA